MAQSKFTVFLSLPPISQSLLELLPFSQLSRYPIWLEKKLFWRNTECAVGVLCVFFKIVWPLPLILLSFVITRSSCFWEMRVLHLNGLPSMRPFPSVEYITAVEGYYLISSIASSYLYLASCGKILCFTNPILSTSLSIQDSQCLFTDCNM